MAAYQTMAEKFYPQDRVYIAGLKTQMRYAGPREAIFHAIIRRNLGCTHFIIGRLVLTAVKILLDLKVPLLPVRHLCIGWKIHDTDHIVRA